MLPFYFLSIIFNAVLGYIFVFAERKQDSGALGAILENEALPLCIGGASLATGLLKILSPVAGNVPVVGDLFPALANISGGFVLIFEYYRAKSSLNSVSADHLEEFIKKHRHILGFICIGAAVMHFIFYSVLFL